MPITPVQDKTITRQVQGKIAGRGLGAPCRITVDTVNGEVTLSGTDQYQQQKQTATQASMGISGVKRVVDRLTVKNIPKY